MSQEIIIKFKHVYGVELIYPACKNAELACKLTGKKTFSHRDLETLQELGFTVKSIAWNQFFTYPQPSQH